MAMTVSMKCFRWPEYYSPDWQLAGLGLKKFAEISLKHKELHQNTLKPISQCIATLKNYKCTKVWQTESEPLDPSGPNLWRFDGKFLQQEVDLVRKIDPGRKIEINAWGNEIGTRRDYPQLAKIADIVSLDIYSKHELSIGGKFIKYVGPHSKKALNKTLNRIRKGGEKSGSQNFMLSPGSQVRLLPKATIRPAFCPRILRLTSNMLLNSNPN